MFLDVLVWMKCVLQDVKKATEVELKGGKKERNLNSEGVRLYFSV